MDQFSALGLQKPSFDMGHRSLTIWDIAASRSSSVQLSTASKNRASSARYRASTSRTSSSASQPRLAALCNSFSCTSGRKCTSIVWAPALILRQRHRKNRKPGQGAGGPFRVKHTLAVILTANQHKAPGPPALIQIIRCTRRHDQGTDEDICIENNPYRRRRRKTVRADSLDCLGDSRLDLLGRHTGVDSLGIRNSLVQNPPADVSQWRASYDISLFSKNPGHRVDSIGRCAGLVVCHSPEVSR